jgi:methyl-accepting chemotaxis protein
MPSTVVALRESYVLLRGEGDRLAELFFRRLCQQLPRLTGLMNRSDPSEIRQQFVQSLALVVRWIDQPAALQRYVDELRVRLSLVRWSPADWQAARGVLLGLLADVLDTAWTPDVQSAWTAAADLVLERLLTADERPAAVAISTLAASRPTDTTRSPRLRTLTTSTTPEPTEPNMDIDTLHQNSDLQINQTPATASALPRRFVEQAPLPIVLCDSQGDVQFLNRAARLLFQQAASDLRVTQETLESGSLRLLREALPGLSELKPSAGVQEFQSQLAGRSYRVTVVSLTGQEAPGAATALMFHDATAQHEAEKRAAESASLLQAIDKSQAVIEFDLEGTILNANQNFLATVGYRLTEIQGKHHSLFVDESYKASPEYQQFWERLRAGEFVAGEFRRIGKGGREVWIQASYNPVLNAEGTVVKVVKYAMDVTAQVQFRRESSWLKSALEAMPINMMMANRNLELTYLNKATLTTLRGLQHLLPKPVDQLMGTSIDLFHKQPEHQRRLLADPKNLPHRAKVKLGPETLDLLVSPVYDADGHYAGPMVTWSVLTQQVKLSEEVRTVASAVSAASAKLQTGCETMSATAEETSRQAQAVSAASEQATRNVETVAAAAEQLSKSIDEISRHVLDASRMTEVAVHESNRTNVSIQELEGASKEIGQVIKVITSIAQQTNLLALNATIEAARAGEAGKGFAVVANEVKELARQTAKATEEISQKIEAIQSSSGVAVGAISSIGESIRRINEISTTIASAVQQQTAATSEISRNVSEAARGTSEVSSNIVSVAEAAHASGRSVAEMLRSATEVDHQSQALNRALTEFLGSDRAA